MTPMRVILFAVVLSACVPGPAGHLRPLTAAEADARDEAVALWAVTHGELSADCEADRERMRVSIVSTHAEMRSAASYVCGPSSAPDDGTNCDHTRAHAAQRPARSGGLWPFALLERQWPLIVMWHSVASPHLLAHEVTHWLDECYGLAPDYHRPEAP